MMNKQQKKNYIEEMTSKFENSKAVMVTHYQGLTMTQLDELRAKMREHGIIFKITKNRITKLALEKTKCKDNKIDTNKKNEKNIQKSPIKEIVKEKKVKKDIPQRAKNDPRQKD